jgi:3-mercaptopyruvate sulfurtransferase SseA
MRHSGHQLDGISATAGLFALALTGRDDTRLYDGSLTECSARPNLPLAAG